MTCSKFHMFLFMICHYTIVYCFYFSIRDAKRKVEWIQQTCRGDFVPRFRCDRTQRRADPLRLARVLPAEQELVAPGMTRGSSAIVPATCIVGMPGRRLGRKTSDKAEGRSGLGQTGRREQSGDRGSQAKLYGRRVEILQNGRWFR